MKTYIPKQPKHTRERLEAKLDARLIRQLEQYCQYLESDRDYVLSRVLELVFRKDKGFADWLGKSAPAAPATTTSIAPQEVGKRIRIGGTD
jgi:hypothetical protein